MHNIEGVRHFLRCVGGPSAVAGAVVCEFGNQHVWEHAMKAHGIRYPVARDWFLSQLGASVYVSIDTNGEDGAYPLNLTRAIYVDEAPFDIVTDIGTAEHVEPYELQPMVFENAHTLCKVGGIMVHQLPPVGQWLDHCRIRYRDELPSILAQNNDYELVECGRVNLATLGGHVDYLAFGLRKTSGNPFNPGEMMEAVEFK